MVMNSIYLLSSSIGVEIHALFAGFQFSFVKTCSGFDLVYFVSNLLGQSKLRFALFVVKERKSCMIFFLLTHFVGQVKFFIEISQRKSTT